MTTPIGRDRHEQDAAKLSTSELHDPADMTESMIRARGTWTIVFGVATSLLTIGLATLWDKAYDEDMPLAYVLPLYFVSLGCIFVGAMEHLSRPVRAAHAEALARMDQIEDGLLMLVKLLPDELANRWYAGYGTAAREVRRTGTEPDRGSAEILNLRRRAERHRNS